VAQRVANAIIDPIAGREDDRKNLQDELTHASERVKRDFSRAATFPSCSGNYWCPGEADWDSAGTQPDGNSRADGAPIAPRPPRIWGRSCW
jgi:hypothetical protein